MAFCFLENQCYRFAPALFDFRTSSLPKSSKILCDGILVAPEQGSRKLVVMMITTLLIFVWFADVVVAAVVVNEKHFQRGGGVGTA